jgi:hypothetical protein
MPVILATQEAEIRRAGVQSQPGQNKLQDSISKKKKKSQKRAGGVAQGVGPEFKPRRNVSQFTTKAPVHPCLLQHYLQINSQAMETTKMPTTDEWIKKMK